jgi:SAM-dependent methyltransferase
MNNCMEFTGERMVPEAADLGTYWEHIYRYAFACSKVKGLNVLDIASGEGYGTNALSKVARRVIGVDISLEAVEHAKSKYHLDFRVGSAEQLPVESDSLDAVISFETVEHVPNPKIFMQEVFRVLKPDGIFIVSTPNKEVYLNGKEPNPYHCSELSKSEFLGLLEPCFHINEILGQRFPTCPMDDFQRFIGRFSNTLAAMVRWQIERPLKKRFLPDGIESNNIVRLNMVAKIPTLSPPFSRLWNPYAICDLKRSTEKQPIYFLALATKWNSNQ